MQQQKAVAISKLEGPREEVRLQQQGGLWSLNKDRSTVDYLTGAGSMEEIQSLMEMQHKV